LRLRTDDIVPLTEHLLKELGSAQAPLTQEVQSLLLGYEWPGNIRELKNVLERALLLAHGEALNLTNFPGLDETVIVQMDGEKLVSLREAEKKYLLKVLASCNGDKHKASALLGISLASIYRKLE
jgi:DNA-binding NtrC family response regulator